MSKPPPRRPPLPTAPPLAASRSSSSGSLAGPSSPASPLSERPNLKVTPNTPLTPPSIEQVLSTMESGQPFPAPVRGGGRAASPALGGQQTLVAQDSPLDLSSSPPTPLEATDAGSGAPKKPPAAPRFALLPGESTICEIERAFCVIPVVSPLVAQGTLVLTEFRVLFDGRTVSTNPNHRTVEEYGAPLPTPPGADEGYDDEAPRLRAPPSSPPTPSAPTANAPTAKAPPARPPPPSSGAQPTRSPKPPSPMERPQSPATSHSPSPTPSPRSSTVVASDPPASKFPATTRASLALPESTGSLSSASSSPRSSQSFADIDSVSTSSEQSDASSLSMLSLADDVDPNLDMLASDSPQPAPQPPGMADDDDENVLLSDSKRSRPAPPQARQLSFALFVSAIGSVRKTSATYLKTHDLWVSEGCQVACKSFGILRFCVNATAAASVQQRVGQLQAFLEKSAGPRLLRKTFAFVHFQAVAQLVGVRFFASYPDPTQEARLFLSMVLNLRDSKTNELDYGTELALSLNSSGSGWRIAHLPTVGLCVSYPPVFCLPQSFPDAAMGQVALFHKEGRFPTVAWVHPQTRAVLLRSAATKQRRGSPNARSDADEKFIQAVCATNKSEVHVKLVVFSEQPSKKMASTVQSGYNAAQGGLNVDMGEAYYYPNCHFALADASLSDPLSVKSSFGKLQLLLYSPGDEAKFLSRLEECKWLDHVRGCLKIAGQAVQLLQAQFAPHVLVAYERGWDRTLVITALAQILAQPACRTIAGFQKLVQKEFIFMGHRFPQRASLVVSGEAASAAAEESPVFLLFLDCVWQLTVQYPDAFEFSGELLVLFADAVYSSRFGTFLLSTERERAKLSLDTETFSFWAYLDVLLQGPGRAAVTCAHYRPAGTLAPLVQTSALRLWTEFYARWAFDADGLSAKTQWGAQEQEMRREIERLEQLLAADLACDSGDTFQRDVADGNAAPSWDAQTVDRHIVAQLFEGDEALLAQCIPSGDFVAAASRTESGMAATLEPAAAPEAPGLATGTPGSPRSKVVNLLECVLATGAVIPNGVSVAPLTCKGFLYKVGGVRKNWKRRWFVLDVSKKCLSYFEDEKDTTPKGVIALMEIAKVTHHTSIPAGGDANALLEFCAVTPRRVYAMRAANDKQVGVWVTAIKSARSLP